MPKPDYLGPYPDVYVGNQRLWKVFAGDKQVWPERPDGIWVVAGRNYIYYSYDGLSWSLANLPVGTTAVVDEGVSPRVKNAIGVNPSTGEWAVAGKNGRIFTSNDGINWDVVNTGLVNSFSSMGYGNGLWVAGQTNFTTAPRQRAAYSSDRVSWTQTGLVIQPFIPYAGSGVYDSHYTGTSPRTWILPNFAYYNYSSTGTGSWFFDYPGSSAYIRKVASNGLGTVVIMLEGTLGYTILTSTDNGDTFPHQYSSVNDYDKDIVYTGTYFITNAGLRSTDGITWTASTQTLSQQSLSDTIAYDFYNNRLVAVGEDFSPQGNLVIYSDNQGDTWITLDASVTGMLGNPVFWGDSIMHVSGTWNTRLV